MRWSNTEIDFLKNNYENADKQVLLGSLSNRTWDAIKLMARKQNLYRSRDFARKSKLNILLNESLTTYYWIGFILADGHIANNKRLCVALSIKDSEHLLKFAEYIQCTNILKGTRTYNGVAHEYISITAQNIDVIPKLAAKFNIVSNKTENPPDMSAYEITNEQRLALIIGFIDGDGSIVKLTNRTDVNLKIKVHSKWFNNLVYIEDAIYAYIMEVKKVESLTRLNTQNYAELVISNNKVIKKLKSFAIGTKLPILERKWSRVII